MLKQVYLPESIYERLPWIYLALAAVLALTPTGSIKWLLMAVLVSLSLLVRRRRRVYRESQQIRRIAAAMEKHGNSRRLDEPSGRTDRITI